MPRFFFALKRSLPLLPILLLCAGWAGTAAAADTACDGLKVADAWVPAAPPGVPVMAAYFKAANTGNTTIKLTAVSSPQFDRASMHESVVDDTGTAGMQPVDAITLAPGESIAFEQGGYHVMMFQPKQTLAAGDTVTLALYCGDPEASLPVTAEVRSRMGGGHGQMDMNHGMDMDNMNQGHMHHGS